MSPYNDNFVADTGGLHVDGDKGYKWINPQLVTGLYIWCKRGLRCYAGVVLLVWCSCGTIPHRTVTILIIFHHTADIVTAQMLEREKWSKYQAC